MPPPLDSSADALRAYARRRATEKGVDPNIIESQLQEESGFEHYDANGNVKTSGAGARGVAQIVPKWHPGVNTDDPYESIDYLIDEDSRNLAKYGDWDRTLAAYNAGGPTVDQYGGVPPYEQTQKYVREILGRPASGKVDYNIDPSIRRAAQEQSSQGPPLAPAPQQVSFSTVNPAIVEKPPASPPPPEPVRFPGMASEDVAGEKEMATQRQARIAPYLSPTTAEEVASSMGVDVPAATRRPGPPLAPPQTPAAPSIEPEQPHVASFPEAVVNAAKSAWATLSDPNLGKYPPEITDYVDKVGAQGLRQQLDDVTSTVDHLQAEYSALPPNTSPAWETPLRLRLEDAKARQSQLQELVSVADSREFGKKARSGQAGIGETLAHMEESTGQAEVASAQQLAGPGGRQILGTAGGAILGGVTMGPAGIVPGAFAGMAVGGVGLPGEPEPEPMEQAPKGTLTRYVQDAASFVEPMLSAVPPTMLPTEPYVQAATRTGRFLQTLGQLGVGLTGANQEFHGLENPNFVRTAEGAARGPLLSPVALVRTMQAERASADVAAKAADVRLAVDQAVEDWRGQRLYADRNGDFHLRQVDEAGKPVAQRGPVAPYSPTLKKEGVTPDLLDKLADLRAGVSPQRLAQRDGMLNAAIDEYTGAVQQIQEVQPRKDALEAKMRDYAVLPSAERAARADEYARLQSEYEYVNREHADAYQRYISAWDDVTSYGESMAGGQLRLPQLRRVDRENASPDELARGYVEALSHRSELDRVLTDAERNEYPNFSGPNLSRDNVLENLQRRNKINQLMDARADVGNEVTSLGEALRNRNPAAWEQVNSLPLAELQSRYGVTPPRINPERTLYQRRYEGLAAGLPPDEFGSAARRVGAVQREIDTEEARLRAAGVNPDRLFHPDSIDGPALARSGWAVMPERLASLYRQREEALQQVDRLAVDRLTNRLPEPSFFTPEQVQVAVHTLAANDPVMREVLRKNWTNLNDGDISALGARLWDALTTGASMGAGDREAALRDTNEVLRAIVGENRSATRPYSSTDALDDLVQKFGYSQGQAAAAVEIARRPARVWAQMTGRPEEEWWGQYIGAVVRGRADDAAGLLQADTRSPEAFYHASLRALNSIKGSRATVAQYRAALSPKNGVKPQELLWTGIGEWLDDMEATAGKDGVLNKADVQAALELRQVHVLTQQNITERHEASVFADKFGTDGEDGAQVRAIRVGDGMDVWEFRRNSRQYDADVNDLENYWVVQSRESDGAPWHMEDWFPDEEDARSTAESLGNGYRVEVGPEGDTPDIYYAVPRGENQWALYEPGYFGGRPAYTIENTGDIESSLYNFAQEQGWTTPGQGSTSYSSYMVKGMQDYSELVISLPMRTFGIDEVEEAQRHFQIDRGNPIFHVRFGYLWAPDDPHRLVVDELQSDWMQAGRSKGFRSAAEQMKLERLNDAWTAAQRRLAPIEQEYRKAYRTISDARALARRQEYERTRDYSKFLEEGPPIQVEAGLEARFNEAQAQATTARHAYNDYRETLGPQEGPLAKTWQETGIRRMIRYAADEGESQISFMAAQPHINRWGTDIYAWSKTPDGWLLLAKPFIHAPEIADAPTRYLEDLWQGNGGKLVTSEDEVRQLIAATPAMVDPSTHSLEKVAHNVWEKMQTADHDVWMPRYEGMQATYGTGELGKGQYPRYLEQWAKQWPGAEVKSEMLGSDEGNIPVYTLNITPDMRQSVLANGVALFQRDIENPIPRPYVSQLGGAIERMGVEAPNGVTGDAWLSRLSRFQVKPAELSWTGMDEWFRSQPRGKRLTADEVQRAFAQRQVLLFDTTRGQGSQDRAKYGSYVLPAGARGESPENYREVLVRLANAPLGYTDGHWDEENVLAHLRLSDRAMLDGDTAVFLEEAQSDPAQAARFQPGLNVPFVDTWHELMGRRALYEAVLQGKDRLAWTGGDVHVNRWSTNAVRWEKNADGSWNIVLSAIIPNAGDIPFLAENPQRLGNLHNGSPFVVRSLDDIPVAQSAWGVDSVKEAESLRERLWKKMQTGDGFWMPRKEGLEELYDRKITNYLRRFGRQFGGEVQQEEMVTRPGIKYVQVIATAPSGRELTFTYQGRAEAIYNLGGLRDGVRTGEEAEAFFNEAVASGRFKVTEEVGAPTTQTVWSIDITPQMRDSVLKNGVTLFQRPNEYVNDPARLAQFRDNLKTTGGIVAELRAADLWSAEDVARYMGQRPAYLDSTIQYMVEQRQKLLNGEVTPRDVAKAWVMTVMSQRSTEQSIETLQRQPGNVGALFAETPESFLSKVQDGSFRIRPEEAAAAWLLSPEGQRALYSVDAGAWVPKAWEGVEKVRKAFGSNQFFSLNVFGGRSTATKGLRMENIGEITRLINEGGQELRDTGNAAKLDAAITRMNGIGDGKTPFLKAILGLGDAGTIDAIETNLWLAGQSTEQRAEQMARRGRPVTPLGDIRQITTPDAALAEAVKAQTYQEPVARQLRDMIDGRMAELRGILGVDDPESPNYLDPQIANGVLHHWLWDVAKQTETTHNGMYLAMKLAQEDQRFQSAARGAVTFGEDGKAIIQAFEGANFSTWLHEMAHIWRRSVLELSEADLRTAAQWAGADDPHTWGVEAEERWARGVERYLREGPLGLAGEPPEVVNLFDRVKQWMTEVYRYVTGSPINVDITPEMRGVFDNLFGVNQQDPAVAGQNARAFADNLNRAAGIDEATRAQIADDLRFTYDTVGNREVVDEAVHLLREDTEKAVERSSENTALGMAISLQRILAAQRDGDHEAAGNIAADLAARLTTAGQFVQAASILGRLSPEGVLTFAAREIHRAVSPGEPMPFLRMSPSEAGEVIRRLHGELTGNDITPEHALRLFEEVVPQQGNRQLSKEQARAVALRVWELTREAEKAQARQTDPDALVFHEGGRTITVSFDSEEERLLYELHELTRGRPAEAGSRDNQNALLQTDTAPNGGKRLLQAAIDKYGYTDDVNKAGWVLPDGKMLDFSGGHPQGRTIDHSEVQALISDLGLWGSTPEDNRGWASTAVFGELTGAVRFGHPSPDYFILEINAPLTEGQRRRILGAVGYTDRVDVDYNANGEYFDSGAALRGRGELRQYLTRVEKEAHSDTLRQADTAGATSDRAAAILARLKELGYDEKTALARGAEVHQAVTRRVSALSGRTEETGSRGKQPANYTRAVGQNRNYDFKYKVVSLDDLIPSHTDSFREQSPEVYPPELQPRERSAAAAREQVIRNATQFNPDELLTDFHSLDRGPMITGADGLVESGNGRVLTLRMLRNEGMPGWQAYQEQLARDIREYGLNRSDLQSTRDPVLIRERVTPLNSLDERRAFAQEANRPTVLGQNRIEQAKQDAALLDDGLISQMVDVENAATPAGLLRSSANRDVARTFLSRLDPNDAARLVDANGALTDEAANRLGAALFLRVYPGEAGERLARNFFGSLDPTLGYIRQGLLGSLGKMAQAEELIRTGQRAADLSLAPDLAAAGDVLARLRAKGKTARWYVEQGQLFDRELTPLQEQLMAYMEEIGGKSARPVRELLDAYADKVKDAPLPGQGGFFGDVPVATKEGLLEAAIKEQGYRDASQTLAERSAQAAQRRGEAAQARESERAARQAAVQARRDERLARRELAQAQARIVQEQRNAEQALTKLERDNARQLVKNAENEERAARQRVEAETKRVADAQRQADAAEQKRMKQEQDAAQRREAEAQAEADKALRAYASMSVQRMNTQERDELAAIAKQRATYVASIRSLDTQERKSAEDAIKALDEQKARLEEQARRALEKQKERSEQMALRKLEEQKQQAPLKEQEAAARKEAKDATARRGEFHALALTPVNAVKLFDKALQDTTARRYLTEDLQKRLVARSKTLQGMPPGRKRVLETALLMRDINEATPASLSAKTATMQVIAQLLNARTIGRNTISNVFFAGSENLSQALAAGLDLVRASTPLVGSGHREVGFPNLVAQGRGFYRGAREGLEEALHGVQISGQPGQVERYGGGRTFRTSAADVVAGGNPLRMAARTPGWILHVAETALNIGLRVSDKAFYQAAVDGAIPELAWVKAYNEGHRGNALSLKSTEYTLNPPEDVLAGAHQRGMYRTFQNESGLASATMALKEALNIVGTGDVRQGRFIRPAKIGGRTIGTHSFGLGNIALNYPRIPANLVMAALDYSPVGFLRVAPDMLGWLLRKDMTDKQVGERLARSIVGTAGLLAPAYVLGQLGILTAGPDKDPDVRNAQQQEGLKNYALNVSALKRVLVDWDFRPEKGASQPGDTWYTYDWAPPLSTVLAAGAQLGKGKAVSKKQDRTATQDAGDFFQQWVIDPAAAGTEVTLLGLNFMADQGILRQIRDMFGGRDFASVVPDVVADTPGQFVPSVLNQLAQYLDNTVYDTQNDSWINEASGRFLARLPGLAGTAWGPKQGLYQLPPQRESLGQGRQRFPANGNTFWQVFLNPGVATQYLPPPELEWVQSVADAAGTTTPYPRVVPKSLQFDDKTWVLTPSERNEYESFVGELTRRSFGALRNSDTFKGAAPKAQAQLLQDTLGTIARQGKDWIVAKSPRLNEGQGILALPEVKAERAAQERDDSALNSGTINHMDWRDRHSARSKAAHDLFASAAEIRNPQASAAVDAAVQQAALGMMDRATDDETLGQLLTLAYRSIPMTFDSSGEELTDDWFDKRDTFIASLPIKERSKVTELLRKNMTSTELEWEKAKEDLRPYWDAQKQVFQRFPFTKVALDRINGTDPGTDERKRAELVNKAATDLYNQQLAALRISIVNRPEVMKAGQTWFGWNPTDKKISLARTAGR